MFYYTVLNYAFINRAIEFHALRSDKNTISEYCRKEEITIDKWIEIDNNQEEMKIFIKRVRSGDNIFLAHIITLGSSFDNVMQLLNILLKKGTIVFCIEEELQLGKGINSKLLADAFALSAKLEKSITSSRTKIGLDRIRKAGVKLGRPKGSKSKRTKLSGKEKNIKMLLKGRVSISAIARLFKVSRITVQNFIDNNNLDG